MGMQLSAAGLDLIKKEEGFRAQKYLDVAGYPTIGYGHRIQPRESFPNGVTDAEATAILEADVQTAEQAVLRLVRVTLTQGQFDALVDFVFNLGAGRLAGSTLLKDLNAGQYAPAGLQLLEWANAGGKPCPPLKLRREAELALWNS